MKSSSRIDLHAFSKNSGWFLAWGIFLVVVGLAAISASVLTTLISILLIGVALIIAGAVVVLDSFTFWWRKGTGFFLHILMGILYLVAGTFLISSPVMGSISLTFVLGIFYVALGLFRLIYSLTARTPHWGWNFFNGLISILLGALILGSWPASSLFVIGLFVGIDLLFTGLVYIIGSMSGKSFLATLNTKM